MNKKILTLSTLALITLFSACRNDDDDDDDILNGSFHAVIDGADWDAEPENTGAVVTNFGSGPAISLEGSRAADTTHFFLSLPYFTGSDTVINIPPSSDLLLRFQGSHVWNANAGIINIVRTTEDGIETYTGSFSGNFREIIDSTNVRVVTGGTFTVKRLI